MTRSYHRELLHDNPLQSVIDDAAEIPQGVTFQEDITTNPVMMQDVTANGDGDAPQKPMMSLCRSGRMIQKASNRHVTLIKHGLDYDCDCNLTQT